jgi:hypothetical protein
MPEVGMVGGSGYASFVTRNMHKQKQALSGRVPVDPSSRLGAFVSTAKFGPGTVGFGAHPAIGGIHSLFGGIGQSTIGTLFNSMGAQNLAAQSIKSGANKGLGTLEHSFWKKTLFSPTSIGEVFGGAMGSSFVPSVRAGIQSTFASVRATAPQLAMKAPGWTGITVGAGIAVRSAWSKYNESPL